MIEKWKCHNTELLYLLLNLYVFSILSLSLYYLLSSIYSNSLFLHTFCILSFFIMPVYVLNSLLHWEMRNYRTPFHCITSHVICDEELHFFQCSTQYRVCSSHNSLTQDIKACYAPISPQWKGLMPPVVQLYTSAVFGLKWKHRTMRSLCAAWAQPHIPPHHANTSAEGSFMLMFSV